MVMLAHANSRHMAASASIPWALGAVGPVSLCHYLRKPLMVVACDI